MEIKHLMLEPNNYSEGGQTGILFLEVNSHGDDHVTEMVISGTYFQWNELDKKVQLPNYQFFNFGEGVCNVHLEAVGTLVD